MEFSHNRHELAVRMRRIQVVIAFLTLIPCVIIGRLVWMQLIQGDICHARGLQNFMRTEQIQPLRGRILDCNGQELVTNQFSYDVHYNGLGNLQLCDSIIAALQAIVPIDLDGDLEALKNAEKRKKTILLKHDVPFALICQLSEHHLLASRITVSRHPMRSYPHGTSACHVLGYLQRASASNSVIGKEGLERHFETGLSGDVGSVRKIVDAKGKRQACEIVNQAHDGQDIPLTLDGHLQRCAESIFESLPVAYQVGAYQAGACVVLDPSNGAIKVMLSSPRFDPNQFLASISHEAWNRDFIQGNALLNRSIQAMYPPASIFKLVTFAAALEKGVINSETEFECTGSVTCGGRPYYCIRRWGHGMVTATSSLAYSCNCFSYRVAELMNIDDFADFAHRLGLGEPTGCVLPEKSGLIPTSEWKRRIKHEPWWKGETLSASIGQSFLLVTPLQVVRMISALFQGYLVRPRLLKNEAVDCSPLHVSSEIRELLMSGLREATRVGTAKALGKLQDFEVYAKTGTAQVGTLDQSQSGNVMYREHGWCVAYFRYKNFHPLAMVVLLEHVGRSRPAVLVVEQFMKFYRDYCES